MRGSTMRILAVEDEPEYLVMLEEVMRSVGHSITVAKDGEEALNILDRERVDVIISDVAMPNMNGIDFHAKVRTRRDYTNTPFIFLTGMSNLRQVKDACKSDADLLLQKPFPIDALLRMFTGQLK
jgi:CheY-like chemotaxis protein